MAATTPRRLAAACGPRLAAIPAGGNDRTLQRDPGPPPRRLVLRRRIPPAPGREARGPPALGTARSPRDARVLRRNQPALLGMAHGIGRQKPPLPVYPDDFCNS